MWRWQRPVYKKKKHPHLFFYNFIFLHVHRNRKITVFSYACTQINAYIIAFARRYTAAERGFWPHPKWLDTMTFKSNYDVLFFFLLFCHVAIVCIRHIILLYKKIYIYKYAKHDRPRHRSSSSESERERARKQ